MSVVIRGIEPGDAARMHELLVEITAESFDFPRPALERYWLDWSEHAITSRAGNPSQVILGAWIGEDPVGLLLGTPPEGGVATIIWLLVAAAHANHGIGAMLFAEAVRLYRIIGAHKIKLTAPSERARDFYVRQGMEIDGFHPDHWWHLDFWSLGMKLDR